MPHFDKKGFSLYIQGLYKSKNIDANSTLYKVAEIVVLNNYWTIDNKT